MARQRRVGGQAGLLAIQHIDGRFQFVQAGGEYQALALVDGSRDGFCLVVVLLGPGMEVVGAVFGDFMIGSLAGFFQQVGRIELGSDDGHPGMLAGLFAIEGHAVEVLGDVQAPLLPKLGNVFHDFLVLFLALLPCLLHDG